MKAMKKVVGLALAVSVSATLVACSSSENINEIAPENYLEWALAEVQKASPLGGSATYDSAITKTPLLDSELEGLTFEGVYFNGSYSDRYSLNPLAGNYLITSSFENGRFGEISNTSFMASDTSGNGIHKGLALPSLPGNAQESKSFISILNEEDGGIRIIAVRQWFEVSVGLEAGRSGSVMEVHNLDTGEMESRIELPQQLIEAEPTGGTDGTHVVFVVKDDNGGVGDSMVYTVNASTGEVVFNERLRSDCESLGALPSRDSLKYFTCDRDDLQIKSINLIDGTEEIVSNVLLGKNDWKGEKLNTPNAQIMDTKSGLVVLTSDDKKTVVTFVPDSGDASTELALPISSDFRSTKIVGDVLTLSGRGGDETADKIKVLNLATGQELFQLSTEKYRSLGLDDVVADENFVYTVSNSQIIKHDIGSGEVLEKDPVSYPLSSSDQRQWLVKDEVGVRQYRVEKVTSVNNS